MTIESRYDGCLDEIAWEIIVHISSTMWNCTGAYPVILGVALSERNEESGKLPLPNNSGRVKDIYRRMQQISWV